METMDRVNGVYRELVAYMMPASNISNKNRRVAGIIQSCERKTWRADFAMTAASILSLKQSVTPVRHHRRYNNKQKKWLSVCERIAHETFTAPH